MTINDLIKEIENQVIHELHEMKLNDEVGKKSTALKNILMVKSCITTLEKEYKSKYWEDK
jgi:hypothetical protein